MSYLRLSVLGTITGGEVWSINPVFDPTLEFPGWTQATADAAAAACAAVAIPSSMLTLLSTAAAVTGIRIEGRNDSDDSLIGVAEAVKLSGGAGTGSPKLPAQAATVVSLRTDTPGARGRGRVYWPSMGATLGTNLRLSLPANGTVVGDMKTYLSGLRSALAGAWPTIGFDLAVRSKVSHTTPHVVRIQVGDIIDTQRRRRDSLPESYSSLAFP